MKEYRLRAYFTGGVYWPRTYRRMIFASLESALEVLPKAIEYYSGRMYHGYFERVAIESRDVTEWHDYKEV